MKNVVIIISNIDKAITFEWLADRIDIKKVKLTFVLLNPGDSFLEKWLIQKSIEVIRIKYTSKRSSFWAIIRLYFILISKKADVIHCHLFDACFVGLIAGKLAGIRKRIYTRHYSTLHHEYFPKAVLYDRLFNAYSTDIIAPSILVKTILISKEQVLESKIKQIHHGFDLEYLSENVSLTSIEKVRYINPKNKSPVIGVISRYIHLKGIQYIVPAFEKLLLDFPDALLVLANVGGDFESSIRTHLDRLPIDSYQEIKFENEIPALFKSFDIYIHVPINNAIEAFGQTYVESLACKIPSIFTLSGVASEFIQDNENALVVDYENSESINVAVKKLLRDKNLRKKLSQNGRNDVERLFTIDVMISKLEKIYVES